MAKSRRTFFMAAEQPKITDSGGVCGLGSEYCFTLTPSRRQGRVCFDAIHVCMFDAKVQFSLVRAERQASESRFVLGVE